MTATLERGRAAAPPGVDGAFGPPPARRARQGTSMATRLVALVVLAMVPTVALTVVQAVEARRQGERAAAGVVRRVAQLVAAEHDNLITSTLALVEVLAKTPEAESLGTDCAALLRDVHAGHPGLTILGVADPSGTPRCSSVPGPLEFTIGDRKYFKDAIASGDVGVGDYQIGRLTGKPTVGVAHVVRSPAGEVVGVTFAAIDLQRPLDLAADLDLPQGTTISVLDARGTILARLPELEGVVGRQFPRLLEGGRAVGAGAARLGTDNVVRIYAVEPLGEVSGSGSGVHVAIGIPVATAHADADRGLRSALAWISLIAAVTAVMAAAVGRVLIQRPVARLATVASDIAGGDLSVRVGHVGGGAELSRLADRFDAMADALASRETELRAAERRAAEERYRGLLDVAADGIVVVDGDGRIVLFGRGAETLLGVDASDVIGTTLDSLRADGGSTRSQRGEIEWSGGDGRRIVADTSFSTGADGLTVVILRDVTARRDAEAALAERNRELEKVNGELEQFAYVASHDLSEPLRVVSGFVQLLDRRYRGRLDESADEYIGFVVDGCDRMRQLIQDLLAYSRVGRMHLEIDDVDTGIIVRTALDRVRVAVDEAGATVDVGPMPVVAANDVMLTQLFQNLLDNAVKFRRPGCAPRVRVEAERVDDAWRFVVADDGIGIAPEHRERVFQMFQRLHTRDEYGGTGIGLALCRKIVEHHGGRIEIDDTPGGGATFTFTIPDRKERP